VVGPLGLKYLNGDSTLEFLFFSLPSFALHYSLVYHPSGYPY